MVAATGGTLLHATVQDCPHSTSPELHHSFPNLRNRAVPGFDGFWLCTKENRATGGLHFVLSL